MAAQTHTVYIPMEIAQGVSTYLIRLGVRHVYELQAEGFRINRHTITVDQTRHELLDRIVAIIKLRQSR